MKKLIAGGPLALLAAFALFAAATTSAGVTQNTNSNTNSGNMNSGNMNSHAGHGKSSGMAADSKFAMEAAMGSMAEIAAGRLAAEKGASEDVKQFGQRMIDDHTKANDELMQLASGKGMTLPTAPDPKHQSHMAKLTGLSGDRFDREYIKMMVSDHKKTLALFQREADRGADAELKGFASRTLPVIQEHLRMAQRISDKMTMRRNSPAGNTNTNANTGR
jgi:putative membrane protein